MFVSGSFSYNPIQVRYYSTVISFNKIKTFGLNSGILYVSEQNEDKEDYIYTELKPVEAVTSSNIGLANEVVVVSHKGDSDGLQITAEYSSVKVQTYAELTPIEPGTSSNINLCDGLVVDPQEKESDYHKITTQYSSESEHSVENLFSDDSDKDPDYVFDDSLEGESQDVSEHDEQTTNDNDQDNVVDEALVGELQDVLENQEEIAIQEDAQNEATAKKGKKRKANRDNWKKNLAKRQRNLGQPYTTSSKSKKEFEKKAMKPPCGEKCRLKCSTKYTEVDRQQIFDEYWAIGEVEKHRSFILSSMQTVAPRYRYQREGSHRKENQAFYFQKNDRKIRVCKLFFMNTLDINTRTIRTVVDKKSTVTGASVIPDLRGKHENHIKVPEFIKYRIKTYIESIPRIESHYCRRNTTREFIDGGKTLSQIHRDYVDECKSEYLPYANYQLFSRIFNEEFNISFFTPKKDQCELCVRYKNLADEDKKTLEDKFETHIMEKDLSRLEKDADKKTEDKTTVVAVYDLQAVLPVPKGDISTFYYVSKINMFNLTVHEIKSGQTDCFIWREGLGKRGANEIGTCVLKYLENLRSRYLECEGKPLDVIFYSDNCCGQQKNRYIIAMYLFAVSHLEFINSITHKYLITGHSQNEGDNAHSVIEKQVKLALKSGPIFVPEQYVALIRTAKKKELHTKYMN